VHGGSPPSGAELFHWVRRTAASLSSYRAKVVVVDPPLALYRRYRPDTFDDVIGQEHVTTPLSHALANNRVNHAYLFSGPRGCGKTTSARIMARALNCEQGPTPTPCGVCDSCVELSTGGTGSLDVIEIDAASHGGVDDARDLRERAFFSPVRSRYKVYIIDEAHMVSKEGFNALLKLVEEPPSHLRFIFATTEPDKVIGTIKSRTHHYPFRLVAPKVLGDYLVTLCDREGVTIEPTVVPLIVRAGAGSVRDSLSVLDQLIGGSGPDGVTYPLATALLGYTPDSLLDETVDALAADDGGTLFGVIEKVIETGQDPRRFAEDLLHRLRDLVVVSAVPDAAARGIIEVPEDQAERSAGQAARFGRAELTRAADIVSQGLTDMRGATAPRLLLEIMCARILLPGLDHTAEGLGARIDRVERRLSVVGEPGTPTSPPPRAPDERGARVAASAPAGQEEPAGRTDDTAGGDATLFDSGATAGSPPQEPPTDGPQAPAASSAPPPAGGREPVGATPAPPRESASGLTLVDARRLWPGVLERVKSMRRFSWLLLSQNAQVKDLHDGIITIGFASSGAAKNFQTSGADEILHQALIDELGVDWRVEGIIEGPGESAGGRVAQAPDPAPAPASPGAAPGDSVSPSPTTLQGSRPPTRPDQATDVSDDDAVVEDTTLSSHELLARELGAEVIEDIRDDVSE
jgi:DNA polymerase III subunit gamma/tau